VKQKKTCIKRLRLEQVINFAIMGPLKVLAKYYRPYQLLIWQLSIIIAYNFKLVLDITNRDSFKVNTKKFKNEENTTK